MNSRYYNSDTYERERETIKIPVNPVAKYDTKVRNVSKSTKGSSVLETDEKHDNPRKCHIQ